MAVFDINKAEKLYKEDNKTLREIALFFHVSYQFVRNSFIKADIKFRSKSEASVLANSKSVHKWTREDIALLKKLYLEQVADRDIAKLLNRTYDAVVYARKVHGLIGSNKKRFPKKWNKTPRGEKHYNWQGGRNIFRGYIEIYKPDHPRTRGGKYVFEHIVVAEEKIGRSLYPNECVHHRDEIKTNNDPDNLQVLTKGEHQKLHAQLRREKLKTDSK